MGIERNRLNDTSYSDTVAVTGPGTWIHVAGQLAFDENRQLVGDDVTTQAQLCLDRIGDLLAQNGGGLKDVVSITVYLTDLDDYPAFDRVRSQRFGSNRPASAAVQIAGLLFGGLIEISAIAFVSADDSGRALSPFRSEPGRAAPGSPGTGRHH